MSTKKKNSNGALDAPVPSLLDEAPITTTPVEPNGKKNGKAKKKVLVELEDEIDSRELLKVLSDVRNGNFSVRLTNDKVGIGGKIYDAVNEIRKLRASLATT